MGEKTNVNIGLKLADGTFYPVFDESFRGSKRLTLTTVHDNQSSVQIDLYKGMEKEVFEDAYIGSLVIENLKPVKKGAAEIELVIGIDPNGNLNATAKDQASGEQQALSVSLESLAQRADYEVPDFDIDKTPTPPADEEPAQTIAGETYPVSDEDRRRSYTVKEKKRSPLLIILLVFLGILVLAGLAALIIWFFFPSIPRQLGITDLFPAATEAPSAEPSPSPAESPTITEVTTPAPETASPSPSAEPSAEPSEEPAASGKGTWYLVVKGDTLWDLSRQYYRDPFQYMKIADAPENNIPNPDLIFENQRIFIPDK